MAVRRLRQALGPAADAVTTIRGKGYRIDERSDVSDSE
jgi:DNA-binding winged helix-turn-helix (wHTH) protein